MSSRVRGAVRLEAAFAEFATTTHGPVLCLLGGVDDQGTSVQIYIDDPKVAHALSVNLFEWSIREELRRKYDGS